ncbi:M23 family metallopeptidase [Bacteriovorax sp. Seq25_V]|uniref:M23 family metallopeptidase n=1 Tax=Bacteriovorax sp. Seq25_V TaxID=1201288 RepID=UPI000389E384|nr:M23 family metallopeptidase [Bacteriovorax sp. Seq25_V]EQC44367.1 peptidase, M23 family [Bacteriovorax sp. Seq25_V]
MKNKIAITTLVTLMAITSNANDGAPIYIWDNQQGLIDARHCHIEEAQSIPFAISSYSGKKSSQTENLRNYNNVRQSHLVIGSLIKEIDGYAKSNYKNIQIVGRNRIDNLKYTRWFSERGDKGYLYNRSIRPVEDFIISVPNQERIQNLIVLNNSNYQYLNCGNERKYFVFKNYESITSKSHNLLVGISPEENDFLAEVKTLPIEDSNNDHLKNSSLHEDDVISESMRASTASSLEETAAINEEMEIKIDEILDFNPTAVLAKQETILEVPEETVDYDVICLPNDVLNVRDDSLERVLFTASKGEEVQRFQSFDPSQDTQEKEINGVSYEFIKVKFSTRSEKDQTIGWVAKKFVLPAKKCRYIGEKPKNDLEKDISITGIDDEKCCNFPTVEKVTHSFTSGMRRFGAGRGSGTRTHAACDLYRFKDEPILAVAPGKVIQNLYYFYQGTYALEVKHSGGFVVRYGELTGDVPSGIRAGATVKMGQRIGYMGVVNSNCCRPMLHFELFKGDHKGPLSTTGNKYRRRGDLIDPTYYLLKWEGMNF